MSIQGTYAHIYVSYTTLVNRI